MVVGAAKLYYRNNPAMYAKMSVLLKELHAEFGWKSRVCSAIASRWLLGSIRREEKRLAEGFSYEPQTFYERNAAVTDLPQAQLCRSADPLPIPAPADLPIVAPKPARKRELAGV